MSSVYFDKPGSQNTRSVFTLSKKRAEKLGVKDIVIASTTGATGVKGSEFFKDYNVVVVTHATGFAAPGTQELKEENRKKILENGAKILTCTHSLSGVERAVRRRFNTILPLEIIANALRLFGEGSKVCIEIAIMAADAGLIPINRKIIAIAGTSRGADTALVIKPAHAADFFDLKVEEIIAKPR